MASLTSLFTGHPSSLGETYAEHRRAALSYAGPLALAAMAAFCHAFLPFLFQRTTTTIVKTLADRMNKRCAVCPSGRLHRPDLFTNVEPKSAS